MTAETLEALQNSIQHWKNMASGRETPDSCTPSGCALCQAFNAKFKGILGAPLNTKPEKEQCHGCPVMEKTGRPFCMNTPYSDYSDYIDEYYETEEFDIDKARRLAQDEVEFLESLLPQKEDITPSQTPLEQPGIGT